MTDVTRLCVGRRACRVLSLFSPMPSIAVAVFIFLINWQWGFYFFRFPRLIRSYASRSRSGHFTEFNWLYATIDASNTFGGDELGLDSLLGGIFTAGSVQRYYGFSDCLPYLLHRLSTGRLFPQLGLFHHFLFRKERRFRFWEGDQFLYVHRKRTPLYREVTTQAYATVT